MRKNAFKKVLFLALLAGLGACVRNPATRKVNARLLSPEAERRIGVETKKKILEEYRVFPSTAVAAYVNRVGQRLANVCDRPTVDYDFTVLDNDLVNAFAVPGGFVFVTRGLLERVNDESELAMVLGHEIAHVAALHGVQMIQKEMGQNALTVLGTIGAALAAGPEAMIMVANTADLFSSLYLLGYSRDKEKEADNLGLQYMLRAGYDPKGALRFLRELEKLDDEDAKGWDLYFRTHPSTKERIEIIEGMIGHDDKSMPHEDDYAKIKAMIPRLDESHRGRIIGQTYKDPVREISLTVPSNWKLDFFQPQALVSFRTVDNVGEGRLQQVELSSSTDNAENLAYEYANAMGFKTESGRNVLYQSGYGYLGHYYGVSGSGKLLDIRLFAIIRRNRGFILMCGAPPEKADSYALDLEGIVRALKFGEL